MDGYREDDDSDGYRSYASHDQMDMSREDLRYYHDDKDVYSEDDEEQYGLSPVLEPSSLLTFVFYIDAGLETFDLSK